MTENLKYRENEPQEVRLELERRTYRLKLRKQRTQQQRVTNESISSLLTVIQYLNSVQDGDAIRIEQTYNRTDIDKRSRILNCHEEDIMNASLITLRRLIESLLPQPQRQRVSPTPASDPCDAADARAS